MFDQLAHQITGTRLVLRPPHPSDAGPMSAYAGDLRVARMTTSLPHPYPPGAAESFIESIRSGRIPERVWAMDASAGGGAPLVGLISVKPQALPELGYWVGAPYWNTGLATEAVGLLVDHLAGSGLMHLGAQVFHDNPASARVLLRNGFTETGSGEVYSVARAGTVAVRRFERGKDAEAE